MEVPKMKTTTCYIFFLKNLILNLMEPCYTNCSSLNIEVVALKKKQVLEKPGFPIYSQKVKHPSELQVTFMMKCDQPRERELADFPPKGTQTQSATRRGQKTMTLMIMTMMIMMMILLMMAMMVELCFLHPKGPPKGLTPGVQ